MGDLGWCPAIRAPPGAGRNDLPGTQRLLFSYKAGNAKRHAFLYDADTVRLLTKRGEIAVPAKDHRSIFLEGIRTPFPDFDRKPYLVLRKDFRLPPVSGIITRPCPLGRGQKLRYDERGQWWPWSVYTTFMSVSVGGLCLTAGISLSSPASGSVLSAETERASQRS